MERRLRVKLENGQFSGVSPQRSSAMRAVRGKGNKTTELRFRMALVREGVKGWVLHPHDVQGSPDVCFPEKKIAVFLDGCFWHGCPKCGHVPRTNRPFWEEKIRRNKERDSKTARKLRRQGFHVLRFWEHQLRDNVSRCLSQVLNVSSSPSK